MEHGMCQIHVFDMDPIIPSTICGKDILFHWIGFVASSCLNWSYIYVNLCREPAREIPPMTRSCRTRGNPWAIWPMTRSCGRVLMSKPSGLNGPPGPAQASTPEPESVCLTILRLSPTHLTLTGGCPRPHFSGKS